MTAPPDIESDLRSCARASGSPPRCTATPTTTPYFGDRHGRFFGCGGIRPPRPSCGCAARAKGSRAIRRFEGINGALGAPTIEAASYDPRERLWFKAGQSQGNAWTAVCIDFKTEEELVCTRAKRVLGTEGQFEGVVATDLSLLQINQFLQKLSISQRGLAMVVGPMAT